jgi:hypothetical protein
MKFMPEVRNHIICYMVPQVTVHTAKKQTLRPAPFAPQLQGKLQPQVQPAIQPTQKTKPMRKGKKVAVC